MNWIRVVALASLMLLLVGLGYFLYLFQTNIEMFQNDPLKKGIELNKFDSCTCNRGNEVWFANSTTIYSNRIEDSFSFKLNNSLLE